MGSNKILLVTSYDVKTKHMNQTVNQEEGESLNKPKTPNPTTVSSTPHGLANANHYSQHL